MIVLTGGDLVRPDGTLSRGTLHLEGARIAAVSDAAAAPRGATIVDVDGGYILPGFVDLHVHGVEGHDTLDEGEAIAAIATRLPRYGVTAFMPTTVACGPEALTRVLEQVSRLQREDAPPHARVIAAHLESNFINPRMCGAQPAACLRAARDDRTGGGAFTGRDILDVIAAHRDAVGIVTMAPELEGGIELVRALVAGGHRVSLGHSSADFETANAAIDAGARGATHLFNRMPPLGHRSPGLAGAALTRDEVAVEVICDGYHVHPALAQIAIAAKGASRVVAITDGTAGSGLPPGSAARLGGRDIRTNGQAAFLPDGTLAGSTLTMDRAFATIVRGFGQSIGEAVQMCSTTPAREMGIADAGVLAPGAYADVVVVDRELRVRRTFVAGREVYGSQELGVRS